MPRSIIAACLGALAFAFLLRGAATGPVSAADAELQVRRGTFTARVLLTGELESVRAERIVVPDAGTWQVPIRWIERDGAQVTAGQTVVELDSTEFSGEVEQKRLEETAAYNDLLAKQAEVAAELDEKGFALESRRIELEKARITASVPAELLPERDYQDAQLALARAEAEFEKATQDVRTVQRATEAALEERRIAMRRTRDEREQAETAIAALSLEAPRDGLFVVSQGRGEGRKLNVGDNVRIGMEVARIPDLDAMRVAAHLIDVDDGQVFVGMRAECTMDTYPDRRFPGEVTEIAPIAQPLTRESPRQAFRVVIRLDESDGTIMRPGMSVRVELYTEPLEDVLIVPRGTVEFAQGAARLRVAGGKRREVTLGPCSAVECVVDDGAEEGLRLERRG